LKKTVLAFLLLLLSQTRASIVSKVEKMRKKGRSRFPLGEKKIPLKEEIFQLHGAVLRLAIRKTKAASANGAGNVTPKHARCRRYVH
jgi:hypothetical protein